MTTSATPANEGPEPAAPWAVPAVDPSPMSPTAAPVSPAVVPSPAVALSPAAAGSPVLADAAERASVAWRLVPLGLAALAAVLYLWNLAVSGYANTYYSAAAQAAAQSWSAMFYGAIDPAGFITVDKPPVSLWAMGLSVKLLGLSPFAVLLPQALAGVASVVFLYDAVRRQLGREAALIAGVAFALLPAATLMFRYNNPDALLTLLLVAAAWAVVRGLEGEGRLRWPLLAAVLVGFAFLTKYLQAYLVLPAFGLVYLVAAPGGVLRRLGVLAAAGVVTFAASAWWVAIVDLTPPTSRPYIGGSTNNTALDLLLGYDGLGRIFGRGGGGVPGGPGGFGGGFGGPGGGGGGFGGAAGPWRLFNEQWAGQVSWLLPSAAAGLVVGLVARLRAPRTDRRRAAFLLWGAWAAVHVVVFSFMGGIVHPYYAVALAPALAALTGGGLWELWRARERAPWAGLVVAAILAGSAWWAWQLLERTPAFWPGVGMGAFFVALAAGIVAVAAFLADDVRSPMLGRGALAVGVAAILVGPALYSGATMDKAIAGGDPAPGPADGGFGGFGGRGLGRGFAGDPAGVDDALVQYLLDHRGGATWIAAVTSANQAGPLQLASGAPVMAMGGFMGSDPAPTLAQLQAYVADGRLRYVLVGGFGGGGPGGFFGGDGRGNVAGERSQWVTQACTAVQGVANGLYDCAGASPASAAP